MKKVIVSLLTIGMVLAPTASEAASTVKYKKQKAGQFCKKLDANKTVVLPDGSVLTCLMNDTRYRWSN